MDSEGIHGLTVPLCNSWVKSSIWRVHRKSLDLMCGKGTLPWRPRASLGETQANGERVQHIEKSPKTRRHSQIHEVKTFNAKNGWNYHSSTFSSLIWTVYHVSRTSWQWVYADHFPLICTNRFLPLSQVTWEAIVSILLSQDPTIRNP